MNPATLISLACMDDEEIMLCCISRYTATRTRAGIATVYVLTIQYPYAHSIVKEDLKSPTVADPESVHCMQRPLANIRVIIDPIGLSVMICWSGPNLRTRKRTHESRLLELAL